MATRMLFSGDTGRTAHCAVLPESLRHSAVASALLAIGNYAQLAKGEALVGDPAQHRLVYILSGAAKLVAPPCPSGESGGTGQVLAFHFPGDMIPVLRQGDGHFRLIALTDCQVVAFPTDGFLDIAEGDPAILRWVLTNSLQALHRSRHRMMQLGHKSARQRIADFLVSMAERMSDARSRTCRIILPMSRRDIGESLGLTIETVSRQFTELRDAGLIETRGRSHVRLLDVPALAQVAGQTCHLGSVQHI